MTTRRILFVHAHPDDETINNGATMARYVAAGAQVTLLTCTRGEQGEVIPARLAHLFGDGEALGAYRVGELATAMAALGVTDHRFLGAPDGSGYQDSGMAYACDGRVVPVPDPPAGAFALADVEVAAAQVGTLIREVRPQVVVSYDPSGGYGHPDHVQAHQVTMRAVTLAELSGADRPGWAVARVYWIVPAGEQATATIDATSYLDAKLAALRAHETQIIVTPDGTRYALSNGIPHPVTAVEHYHLAHGTPAHPHDPDLFAGLPT